MIGQIKERLMDLVRESSVALFRLQEQAWDDLFLGKDLPKLSNCICILIDLGRRDHQIEHV